MKLSPFAWASLMAVLVASSAQAGEWRSLFNGEDLTGWQPYVSFQPETNAHDLVSKHTPRGINNDPKQVFTVVDGLLRVSGEEWGGLTSQEEFGAFHLKFEVKWGEKKWPPRLDAPRDSGLLYFAVGPEGAQSRHWLRSHLPHAELVEVDDEGGVQCHEVWIPCGAPARQIKGARGFGFRPRKSWRRIRIRRSR